MITLELAKAQCRVLHDDEDVLIEQYIAASQAWLERYTRTMFEETEVVDTFVEFTDYLELSRGPFVELTSIAYTDSAGDPQEVEAARVQDGLVYPPTTGWPAPLAYSTITVTYMAGYGVYSTLPVELDQAQLLLIGHWYQNREAVLTGSISKEIEYSVEALAGPFRLPTVR